MYTVVVGVDIGMTFTGVAYALHQRDSLTGEPDPYFPDIGWINRWPGRENEIKNKAPTVVTVFPGLSYQEGKFPQWGFLCAKVEDEQAALHSKFKLLLEKAVCDSVFANWPRGEFAHEDVKSWYRVYLKGLYSWIQGSLEAVLMEKHNIIFQDHRVIYTFSVPTTWSPEGSTVSLFRKLIHEAGFGKLPNHSFRIGLTEAEAAAVSTMMDPTSGDYVPEFHEGDVVITADMGGGTTDVTALRLTKVVAARGTENQRYQMEQLSTVEGRVIGSTDIDSRLTELIDARLKAIPKSETPWKKRKDFDEIIIALKENFGGPLVKLLPSFRADVLQPTENSDEAYDLLSFPDQKIFCGSVEIQQQELQKIFDRILEEIIELIQKQLEKQSTPIQRCYLALTGGLSCSPYVKERLEKHFRDMQVLRSKDPRDPPLAVCRGLVIDMLDQLRGNGSLITRRSRCSYGIIYREKFSREKHIGQLCSRDPINKKAYAVNCIKWLIDEGQLIEQSITQYHEVTRCIPAKSEKVCYKECIVAHKGKMRPDYYFDNNGVTCVAEMDVKFPIEMRHLNSKAVKTKYRFDLWTGSKKYWMIDYKIVMRVGPADLAIELWYHGEKMGSNDVELDYHEAYDEELTQQSGRYYGLHSTKSGYSGFR